MVRETATTEYLAHIEESDTVAGMSDSEHETLRFRLATAQALLDPRRRELQRDVYVSAVLEILGTSPVPLSKDRIAEEVRRVWSAGGVSRRQVDEAVDLAFKAGFIRQVTDFEGSPAYQSSATTKEQVESDAKRAEEVLSEFRQELGLRLAELVDVHPSRLSSLADHLLMACVVATSGAYDVARDADHLLPLELDLQAMANHLKTCVQPKSVREALMKVAEAVADPDDEYGNEILHLLLTGNILRGLLSREDVPLENPLTSQRIILDTSTLVYSLDPESPEGQVFEALLSESLSAGVSVVVPDHVLEEWDLHWEEASTEISRFGNDDVDLLAMAPTLLHNAVTRAFASCRSRDPNLTWARFKATRHPIKKTLASRGVEFRPHGNGPEEKVFIEKVSAHLKRPGVRRKPSERKALRDANSAAMVARWRSRDNLEPPGAWFVALDTATGRAYAKERPGDRYPLTVTPESWLMFISSVAPPDPTTLTERVSAIGSAIRRGSFLNVAASYSAEDALKVLKILTVKDEGVSLDELRETVQFEFQHLIERSNGVERDPAQIALSVVQRSLKRNDRRALRESREAKQKEALLQAKESELERERLEVEQEKQRLEAQLREERQARESAQAEAAAAKAATDAEKTRNRRRRVRTAVLIAHAIGAVLFGVLAGFDAYTRSPVPGLVVLIGFILLLNWMNQYVKDLSTTLRDQLWKGVVAAAMHLLSFLLQQIWP